LSQFYLLIYLKSLY